VARRAASATPRRNQAQGAAAWFTLIVSNIAVRNGKSNPTASDPYLAAELSVAKAR
jgi:hypothetical protein